MDLEQRIAQVEARIRDACKKSGRAREEVNVIAVTKYVSVDATRKVIEAGLNQIGENRWQTASAKWQELGPQATWHFIGHLQTNKVKDVVGKFSYIHSLDRLSLAKALQKRAEMLDIDVNCMLQLNISGELSKHGLSPDECMSFVKEMATFDRLKIIGLMTMAPHEEDPEDTRPIFHTLREWKDRLNKEGVLPHRIEHLSMGMSNDFEIAIQEGATWIRLGSVLVGKS